MLDRLRTSGLRPIVLALYALAMIGLGFAHQAPVVPLDAEARAELAAFALPDGSTPDLCLTGGVMTMRKLEKGLEIAPGATVELKPGGFHVMLIDLKQPLVEGEKVKGTLVFEKAGTVEVEFAVEKLGAPAAGGGHDHSGHDMKKN